MRMTSQKGAPACWGSNEALPRAPSPSMQPEGQPLHAIPPGWPGPAHWLRGWAPMRSASTTRARSATSLDPQHGVVVMETWRQCIRSITGPALLTLRVIFVKHLISFLMFSLHLSLDLYIFTYNCFMVQGSTVTASLHQRLILTMFYPRFTWIHGLIVLGIYSLVYIFSSFLLCVILLYVRCIILIHCV